MYSLGCCTFKFMHNASSAGISKVITHENDCLPYVFCCTLPGFGIGGSRTPAKCKMELFETKDFGWKLSLLLERVPSYM